MILAKLFAKLFGIFLALFTLYMLRVVKGSSGEGNKMYKIQLNKNVSMQIGFFN